MQQAAITVLKAQRSTLYARGHIYRAKGSKALTARLRPDPGLQLHHVRRCWHCHTQKNRQQRHLPILGKAYLLCHTVNIHVVVEFRLVAGFSFLRVQLLGCETVVSTQISGDVHVTDLLQLLQSQDFLLQYTSIQFSQVNYTGFQRL